MSAQHILLLRHGETDANRLRLYVGATDVPLSAQGTAALAALKQAGLYPSVSGYDLYTSGMRRAVQTAGVLWPGASPLPLPALREMDFGAFEMHAYADLQHQAAYRRWISNASGDIECPGGESANGFRSRVWAGFLALKGSGRDAAVIAHGGVIAHIMERLFPGEARTFYQWQPPHGRGYLLAFEGGFTAYRPVPPTTHGKDGPI